MKTILILLLISFESHAFNLKIRAREHYEIHEMKKDNQIDIYRGLTNTINIWWEKPYDEYFGFSFSPIIAGIKAKKRETFGKKITQQNIGFEYKRFPFREKAKTFFYRLGTGYSTLEANSGNINYFYGTYVYLGLGREIPIKNFGLALEMAYRYNDYNHGLYVKTISPSVGFHFYKDL